MKMLNKSTKKNRKLYKNAKQKFKKLENYIKMLNKSTKN